MITQNVNWKRPPEWDRFRALAVDTHGSAAGETDVPRPGSLGFLLEAAWAEFRDAVDGTPRAVTLIDALLEEGDAIAELEGEKKNELATRSRSRGAGEGRVGARIHTEVKTEMSAFADEIGVPNHEVLRAVVCFYLAGGTLGRVERTLERLVDQDGSIEIDADDDVDDAAPQSAKERRTLAIADELRGGQFTTKEFLEAIEEAATGIGATEYALETYLGPVLDELGYTWHPDCSRLFTSPDDVEIPPHRDPRGMPYPLADDDDRRLAVKAEGYETVRSGGQTTLSLSVSEAQDVVPGNPQRSTVRDLMREVADSSPGYTFDDSKDRLNLDLRRIETAEDENADVIRIFEGEAERDREPEPVTEPAATDDVEVEDLEPDPVPEPEAEPEPGDDRDRDPTTDGPRPGWVDRAVAVLRTRSLLLRELESFDEGSRASLVDPFIQEAMYPDADPDTLEDVQVTEHERHRVLREVGCGDLVTSEPRRATITVRAAD